MKDTLTTNAIIQLCKIYGVNEKDIVRLLRLKEEKEGETTTRDFYLGIGG